MMAPRHATANARPPRGLLAAFFAGALGGCGIVELGDKDAVYDNPRHPYTRALLSAVPLPDPKAERARRRIILQGDVPSPLNPPDGCRFASRCPIAETRCRTETPPLVPMPGAAHPVACWRAGEVDALLPTSVAAA